MDLKAHHFRAIVEAICLALKKGKKEPLICPPGLCGRLSIRFVRGHHNHFRQFY